MRYLANLLQSPQHFDFFHAIGLLKKISPNANIIFKSTINLNFPSCEIYKIINIQNTNYTLIGNFIGLWGPHGPLPNPYQETLKKNNSLELFNHYLISLTYQAWEKTRLWISDERHTTEQKISPLQKILMSLSGNQDRSLLFYTGLFMLRPRNPAVLKTILQDYFQLPFRIIGHVSTWQVWQRTTICFGNLGISAALGSYFLDAANTFRIVIGPLHYPQYLDWLPNQATSAACLKLIRWLIGNDLEFQIHLEILRHEMPSCQLLHSKAPQLGWTSWLGQQQTSILAIKQCHIK